MASEMSPQGGSEESGVRPDEGRPAASFQSEHDEPCELDAAAEAVRRAKEELREARRAYWQLRRQAVERLAHVREMSVGEVVDKTLKQVKRHPGPSVVVAVLAGFFLGRLFRR